MFAPNATSPAVAPRKRAAVSCAAASSASVRCEVANGPPRFAFELAEVAGDRVDHRVGHLGAAGAVEERERLLERSEARADVGDRRHATRHV